MRPCFFHDGEKFEGRAARLLCAGLPLFDGGFADVEVASEDRLADAMTLPETFDFPWFNRSRDGEARFVKLPHGGLVDRTDLEQRGS